MHKTESVIRLIQICRDVIGLPYCSYDQLAETEIHVDTIEEDSAFEDGIR